MNAALRVLMEPGTSEGGEGSRGWKVKDCTLAYGGMSYVTLMATRTQQALLGRLVTYNCKNSKFLVCMVADIAPIPYTILYGIHLDCGMKLLCKRLLVSFQRNFIYHQMLLEACQSIGCVLSPPISSNFI